MPDKKIFDVLPFWGKFLGGALMVVGLVASYYFIYLSIKPDWLQTDVFTLYSKYLETNTFSFITNNQGDEVAIVCYLVGFLILLFSGDRNQPETDYKHKLETSGYTILLVALLFIISYLLIHGMAIVYTVVLLLFFIPIVYTVLYFILKLQKTKS